jgi:hypothetical protein
MEGSRQWETQTSHLLSSAILGDPLVRRVRIVARVVFMCVSVRDCLLLLFVGSKALVFLYGLEVSDQRSQGQEVPRQLLGLSLATMQSNKQLLLPR